MGPPYVLDRAKIEMLVSPIVQRTIKAEAKCDGLDECFGNRKGSDGDEVLVFEMTLKELKERCRTKKNKVAKFVNSAKKDICIGSGEHNISSKQDNASLHRNEDQPDLEEPLTILKKKFSDEAKSKRKHIGEDIYLSTLSGVSIVAATKQIDSASESSFKKGQDVREPSEISETHSSDCQHMVYFTGGSDSKTSSCEELSDKARKRNKSKRKLTKKHVCSSILSTISTEEATEQVNPALDSSSKKARDMHGPVEISETNSSDCQHVVCFPNGSELHVKIWPREQLSDKACKKRKRKRKRNKKHAYSSFVSGVSTEAATEQIDSASESSSKKARILHGHHEIIETHSSDSQHMVCFPNGSEPELHVKISSCEGLCDDTPKKPGRNDLESGESTSLTKEFQSGRDSFECVGLLPLPVTHLMLSKENIEIAFPPKTPSRSDRDVWCQSGIPLFDNSDKPIAVEVLDNHRGAQPECCPERLLSTRKAISPTSQEKLCQAAEAEELFENIGYSDKSFSGLGFDGAKFVRSLDQDLQKPKNGRNEAPQAVSRSILKDPNVSSGMPNDGAECILIHPCAQDAVVFSKRQMQDIESVATKLMKELKSMKDIVAETLFAKERSSLSSKHTADEIRMALLKATKVEKYADKSLYIMGRDCRRFCKIMTSSSEKKTGFVSGCSVSKEKKVVFADEAGGLLCHVKVLEDYPASL